MIYLGNLKEISSGKLDIGFIHYMPFDAQYGLNKTEEELLKDGVFVNEIPKAEIVSGKNSIMFYNPLTKSIFYEYIDAPKNKEQLLEEKIELLQERSLTAIEKYNLLEIDNTDLEDLRVAKLNSLKENCIQAIYNGFHSNSVNHEFGFNDLDQVNFTQQMLMVVAGDTKEIQWKTKDAGVVTLTVEQFKTVVQEAAAHKLVQQQKYWQIEQQVINANSKEQITTLNW